MTDQPIVPNTPADIDAAIERERTAYRNGFRDGATEVAHALGYQVEVETGGSNRPAFGVLPFIILATAIYFVFILAKNSETFPRVERAA